MKHLTDKDGNRDKTHDILTKPKSKLNPPEARRLTIDNSSSGCISEASLEILNTCVFIMKRCRPNGSVRGMYELTRGILNLNISLKLDKNGNILTTFQTLNSTQGVLKDIQNYATY